MLERMMNHKAEVNEGDIQDKIMSALKVLDEAAVEKGDEIKELLNKKFHQLRDKLEDWEVVSGEAVEELTKKGRYLTKKLGEQSTKAVRKVDRTVQNNPYIAIGMGAAVGLLTGFVLGRRILSK